MDIPIGASVVCEDGQAGQVTCIVLNPIKEQVTHFVVRPRHAPHKEVLVPLAWIKGGDHQKIQLNCTLQAFESAEPFVESEFIQTTFEHLEAREQMAWPLVVAETRYVPVHHQRIPLDELAVRRGARVVDKSGKEVGTVDEFLVDPADGRITHLVMREAHLWGQMDVSIPVSGIERVRENKVRLNLSRQEIAELPEVPIRRNNW